MNDGNFFCFGKHVLLIFFITCFSAAIMANQAIFECDTLYINTPFIQNLLNTSLNQSYSGSLDEYQGSKTITIEKNIVAVDLKKQYSICITHIQEIEKKLLAILHVLYQSVDYWEKQKIHPLRYFIRRGPVEWFTGQPQKEKIGQTLDALHKYIVLYTDHLGHIQEKIAQSKSITNQQELQDYIYHLAKLVNHCLKESSIYPATNKYSLVTLKEIDGVLAHNTNLLKTYPQSLYNAVNSYLEPSHLRHRWIEYSAVAVVAPLTYFLITKNVDWLINKREKGKQYINGLYEKSNKAIQEALDVVYNNKDIEVKLSRKIEKIKKIKDEINAYGKSFEEFMNVWYTDFYKKKYPEKSDTEIEATIKASLATRWLTSELKKHFGEEFKAPLKNAINPFGSIVKEGGVIVSNGILIILDLVSELLEDYDELQEIKSAQKLNIALSGALPAFLLSVLVLNYGYKAISYCSKKTYSFFVHNKLNEVKKAILTLDRILNAHNNEKNTVDYTVKGQLHYWLCLLVQIFPHVPHAEQQAFMGDIIELSSSNFNIQQKYAVITRMYRTYSFLK